MEKVKRLIDAIPKEYGCTSVALNYKHGKRDFVYRDIQITFDSHNKTELFFGKVPIFCYIPDIFLEDL